MEYDGTDYHGWQLQKNLPTVQGAIETALTTILRAPVRVHGAGRTDAGVHAIGQAAHFDAEWAHTLPELHRGCNALLPPDVAFRALSRVNDAFHARHGAVTKTYEYRILRTACRSPVLRRYTWHVPKDMDLPAMQEAASRLIGSHDFATFGQPTDGTPSTVRKIISAGWTADNATDILTFRICGTGFLRYMVRSLVGTLADVGLGRMSPDELTRALKLCDRSQAGATAPPQGLFLMAVEYEKPPGPE